MRFRRLGTNISTTPANTAGDIDRAREWPSVPETTRFGAPGRPRRDHVKQQWVSSGPK
jgi:hypothetical protein